MAKIKSATNKITPCLWFDSNAKEAVKFYTSVFKKSKIRKVTYYGEGGFLPAGTVLTIDFELAGQSFTALNGGPHFKFNEAISFVVNCDNQKEINYYWEKLSKGGAKVQCGWLKDKFGLSWQIVPTQLPKWLTDKNPEKAARVMQEIMKMKKLDIKKLEKAFIGK